MAAGAVITVMSVNGMAAGPAPTAAGQAVVDQINQQRNDLGNQIQQVQAALNKLSASQRHALSSDTGPTGVYIALPGLANTALQAALTRRGDAYVYGHDGR